MPWISVVADVSDLSDVDTTGAQGEDVLMFESSSSTWKAAAPSVVLLSETAGHVLELEDGNPAMSEPTFRS